LLTSPLPPIVLLPSALSCGAISLPRVVDQELPLVL
jgi:hypothetical protein